MEDKVNDTQSPTGPPPQNVWIGCLGLVALSVFCMVVAAGLVYGVQALLGW